MARKRRFSGYLALFAILMMMLVGVILFVLFYNPTPVHEHVFTIETVKTVCGQLHGHERATCECGYVRDIPLPYYDEHVFGEWTEVSPATYFDKGLRQRVCKQCGYIEQDEIDLLYYDFSSVDYTSLETTLENIPEFLSTICTGKSLDGLYALRDDIRSRYGRLTQDMADACIVEFTAAMQNLEYTRGDTPRIYIFSDDFANESKLGTKLKTYRESAIVAVSAEGSNYTVCDLSAQTRIRGNTTGELYNTKRPYNIKFSSKQNLFGMGQAKKWALLANAFDKSLIRNALVLEFGRQLNLHYLSNYTFIEVWLNGVYQGSYMATENVDVSASRVDIDIAAGDFLIEVERSRTDSSSTYVRTSMGMRFCINEPETPSDEQVNSIKVFLDAVEAAMKSGSRDRLSELCDVESFVDFYILSEVIKNQDVAFSSTRFYTKDGKLYAGPLWDWDISSGNVHQTYYPDYNNLSTTGDSTQGLWTCVNMKWYKELVKHDWFVTEYKARYIELIPVIENLYMDNSLGQNLIDRLVNANITSFTRNFTESKSTLRTDIRLGRMPNKTYAGNVEFLREWLCKRDAWLRNKWGI